MSHFVNVCVHFYVLDDVLPLSETTFMIIKTDGNVVIRDESRNDEVALTPERLITLALAAQDIETAVSQLDSTHDVKFMHHIGDTWYASVTSGYRSVNIRCFYKRKGQLKPKGEGIVLRLPEWANLYALLQTMSVIPECREGPATIIEK
jgi:hypothetical protein